MVFFQNFFFLVCGVLFSGLEWARLLGPDDKATWSGPKGFTSSRSMDAASSPSTPAHPTSLLGFSPPRALRLRLVACKRPSRFHHSRRPGRKRGGTLRQLSDLAFSVRSDANLGFGVGYLLICLFGSHSFGSRGAATALVVSATVGGLSRWRLSRPPSPVTPSSPASIAS